ncbi:MAG: hypothetical protein GF383_14440 [Candidatus Lokiarchaeota archaeon]|nr:hypothetical protein [Candidatus Lokiarchaeota archaeon]MBD3342589.1 hypothetical protein [Candidatus Lokiarchaeota archaeon]
MMGSDKIELIEKRLKFQEIKDYEIYLTKTNIIETQFLKNKIESERELHTFDYFLRILSHKENETGVGIVKGNSFNSNNVDSNIRLCSTLSKHNLSSKYELPYPQKLGYVKTAEEKVLKNPKQINRDLTEEIQSEIAGYKEISPTFGRFRIHIQDKYLRNSNNVDLFAQKSYFYFEFALKAQNKGKLAESWETGYVKNIDQLRFPERIQKWVKIAKDTLKASLPISNEKAIVLFPTHILKDALNSVVAFHSSGRAKHEGLSKFEINKKVATENLTIFDNGLLQGGLMTNSWDGEGNPQEVNKIIDNGIFKKRLFDQKYAILENTKSSGNGIRNSDGSISNTITNLQIEPGVISLKEMISEIKEGYYIEKCSWLNPDPLSGFFGTEIRNGYYIKNGELRHPIKGGNLSGNILKMLSNCLYISRETEFAENSYFPSIFFDNLSISS